MKAGNGADVRCAACGGDVRDCGSRLDLETGETIEIYQCRDHKQKRCVYLIHVRVR